MEKDEGMSLVEMVKIADSFFTELKKKWLVIAIFVVITSGLGLYYSSTQKPQFIAESAMMLESSKGGSASGALALASQFGLMGSSSSAVITEDKLIEIIKTETIIRSTFFKKTTIDSSTDILANHFIELFGYRKAWKNDDSLKNFRFENSEENITIKENRVLKMFYKRIIANFLTIEKSKSGIITVRTTTPSEKFSKDFNTYLVETATKFYVNRIAAKGKKSVDIIEKRVDSITIELKETEFALARWKDANFRLVKAQGMIEELRLRRNVEIKNALYLEGVKRLEVAKFSLLDETPFLQIIDSPTLPLNIAKGITTPLRGITVGFFLGFLFSVIFIFGRNKYTELKTEMAATKE